MPPPPPCFVSLFWLFGTHPPTFLYVLGTFTSKINLKKIGSHWVSHKSLFTDPQHQNKISPQYTFLQHYLRFWGLKTLCFYESFFGSHWVSRKRPKTPSRSELDLPFFGLNMFFVTPLCPKHSLMYLKWYVRVKNGCHLSFFWDKILPSWPKWSKLAKNQGEIMGKV